jgi:hypothetical protein
MISAKRTLCASAIVIALGVMPVTAHARGHGGHAGGRSFVGGHAGSRSFVGGHNHGGHFHHRSFGSRVVVFAPFVPFGYGYYGDYGGYYGAPSVYSDPPASYAPPPVSYPTPIAYGQNAYAAPPASAYGPPVPPAYAPPTRQDVEPLQREVVFPSGRYVLSGDGITTPYTWVWIPNPPSAPPGGTPSSGREHPVYSWTDANGVTTWTDRPWTIPAQYRSQARREL